MAVFALLCLLAGASLLALSGWLGARARACRQWPSVTGEILEAQVDLSDLELARPVLRYRYVVGGRAYTGFRASYSGHGVSTAAMQQVVQPYAVGQAVEVYYDPQDPASAVLDNTVTADSLYWAVFGIGFLWLGAWLAWR